MERFVFDRGSCYKIDIPTSTNETIFLEQYCDLLNFEKTSPIIGSYSFDVERFKHYTLLAYVAEFKLNKSILYFYEEHKHNEIAKLSVKQKLILSISLYFYCDCIFISLEALSKKTKLFLIFLLYFFKDYKDEKTFIFFNHSTLATEFTSIEVQKIEPIFNEIPLKKW